jgi:hypothetical protein
MFSSQLFRPAPALRRFFFALSALVRCAIFVIFVGFWSALSAWGQDLSSASAYDLRPGQKIIITDATFKQGSAVIEESQQQAFTKLALFLKSRERLKIEIGGHADNIGGETQNTALSLSRAEAVRDFFVANGVSANRIQTKGYGAQFPIADNTTEEGRAKNRRVEIIGVSAFSGKLLASPDGEAIEPEARISSLRPRVMVLPTWESEWKEATTGEPLYEAFQITTMEGAKAALTFRNKSVLQIGANSLLMIYGYNPTRGGGESGIVKRETFSMNSSRDNARNIELSRGELSLKLKEMREQDTYSIQTNASSIGLGARNATAAAKVRIDEKNRSIISIMEGRANVGVLEGDPRQGQTLDIEENQGVIVGDAAASALGVRELPSAPRLLEPSSTSLELPDGGGEILFRWSSAEGNPVKLEIAADVDFSELVFARLVQAQETRVKLSAGGYFVRLTALDSLGFESKSALSALQIHATTTDGENLGDERARPFRTVEFLLLLGACASFWAGHLLRERKLHWLALGLLTLGAAALLLG